MKRHIALACRAKARASCASGPVIKTAERQKQSQILVAEARSRRRIGERQ